MERAINKIDELQVFCLLTDKGMYIEYRICVSIEWKTIKYSCINEKVSLLLPPQQQKQYASIYFFLKNDDRELKLELRWNNGGVRWMALEIDVLKINFYNFPLKVGNVIDWNQ